MARPANKFKNASSEVIQENILQENPAGLPDEASGLVVAKDIPEMRKVMFQNGRDDGHELTFHYASKTHPLKHYTLFHGVEVELPVEIVEHLESCPKYHYAYRKNAAGHPEMYVKSISYPFSFKTVKKTPYGKAA